MTDPNDVRNALRYINADDRETWVLMAMAVKSGLGEDGRELWMEWSGSSAKFNADNALMVWRSVNRHGAVNVGTLYKRAQEGGWDRQVRPSDWERPPVSEEQAERERETERVRLIEADRAAKRGAFMVDSATLDYHDYLTGKGFASQQGFVLEGQLLIPMRDIRTHIIRGVQSIDSAGFKKFLPKGCSISNCVHQIGGRGAAWWWVDGYATGLSVYEALRKLYRPNDRVVVAFSAQSVARLARHGFVIADHDWYTCPKRECHHKWDAEWGTVTHCPECGGKSITLPAGEQYARKSRLPWWMPPMPGEDANDMHQRLGLDALCESMLEAIRSEVQGG